MWTGKKHYIGLISLLGAMLGACGDNDQAEGNAGVGRTAVCEEPGLACTWMGIKGETGFNGDGFHRLDTNLGQAQDLVFLGDGTPWITDFNNFLIRRVLDDDTVETMVGYDKIFPGDGPLGGAGPDGAPGKDWQLNHPTNLLADQDGNLIVVGWHNHKILHVDSETGWVRIVCGSGAGFAGDGGPAAQGALFKQPNDAVMDDDGSLYILDQQNFRIRKVDADGMLSTIAGNGTNGFSGDGGSALEAQFHWAYGSNPNPSGGITMQGDVLYISDTENNRIRTVDLTTGIVDTVAGNGEEGYSGDGGPALEAALQAPRDLEFGPDGDLYFADTNNHVVRAIDLESGEIRTVVGTGEAGLDEAEGLAATETMLRRPMGVAFDADGNLYVVDTLNDRIVRVVQ